MEKMLKWVRSLKKVTPVEQIAQSDNFANFIRNSPLMGADVEFERDESISVGLALQNFLKKYEDDPIDIDTSIFDDYRKTVTEREIDLSKMPQDPVSSGRGCSGIFGAAPLLS
jgi:hypothetical protein